MTFSMLYVMQLNIKKTILIAEEAWAGEMSSMLLTLPLNDILGFGLLDMLSLASHCLNGRRHFTHISGSCILKSYNSPLSTQQKLSQHHVQSTVTSTSKRWKRVSFVSQTFRQRRLQTERTKIKGSTEEQSIQDMLLRISEANATSVNSWM